MTCSTVHSRLQVHKPTNKQNYFFNKVENHKLHGTLDSCMPPHQSPKSEECCFTVFAATQGLHCLQFSSEEIRSLKEFRSGKAHTPAKRFPKKYGLLRDYWWLREDGADFFKNVHLVLCHTSTVSYQYLLLYSSMIQINNVQEACLSPHFRTFFFLLSMLLNYVSGPHPVVHSFFLKWK